MILESVILIRLFEDADMRAALADFFEFQVALETAAAANCMGQDVPETELARKHACFAKAYEEGIHRLRSYAYGARQV